MIIQKLPWAGIRVSCGGTSIAIDPLYHFPSKFGSSHEPLFPLDEFGPVDAVLITHHHGDHFDPEAIAAFYGANVSVYLPQASLKFTDSSILTGLKGVDLHETVKIGELSVTASYSVDGVGDPQVSWVIEGDGKRVIHCGDTLWHGYWWKIAAQYGPIDAACLPVNGAVVQFPGATPSGQPIVMNPEQAAAAASVLKASVLIPIHYRAIHHPPIYSETPNVLERLQASAEGKVRLAVLQTKETIEL